MVGWRSCWSETGLVNFDSCKNAMQMSMDQTVGLKYFMIKLGVLVSLRKVRFIKSGKMIPDEQTKDACNDLQLEETKTQEWTVEAGTSETPKPNIVH